MSRIRASRLTQRRPRRSAVARKRSERTLETASEPTRELGIDRATRDLAISQPPSAPRLYGRDPRQAPVHTTVVRTGLQPKLRPYNGCTYGPSAQAPSIQRLHVRAFNSSAVHTTVARTGHQARLRTYNRCPYGGSLEGQSIQPQYPPLEPNDVGHSRRQKCENERYLTLH